MLNAQLTMSPAHLAVITDVAVNVLLVHGLWTVEDQYFVFWGSLERGSLHELMRPKKH